jgi:ribosomal protein S3AE
VFEASLADLQNDEDQAHRKIRLRAEDVQGRNVLTNFWVMNDLWLVVHYLDTVFSLISQLRTYPINC